MVNTGGAAHPGQCQYSTISHLPTRPCRPVPASGRDRCRGRGPDSLQFPVLPSPSDSRTLPPESIEYCK